MKKILLFVIIVFLFLNSHISYAISDQEEQIMNSQKDELNISAFVNESSNYTKEVFQDVDYNELLNSAISGKVDNGSLLKKIGIFLGKETMKSATTLRKYNGNYCNT